MDYITIFEIVKRFCSICCLIFLFAFMFFINLCAMVSIGYEYFKAKGRKEPFEYVLNMRDNWSFCIFTNVLFSVILCRFHWRNQHRCIALIFNVVYFIYRETMHGALTWVLYIAIRVSNGDWNIFRASSIILAGIILIFNSMQCTWLHIKCIYCTFKGKPVGRSVLVPISYTFLILAFMILCFIPSFWTFILCPLVATILGAILWLPRGLASLFNASKFHRTLATRNFQIYPGILLFVEVCFSLIVHFSANDAKLSLMLMITLDYSLYTLASVATLTCIFHSEIGNIDEEEKSKFGWAMEITRKYWAPAWQ